MRTSGWINVWFCSGSLWLLYCCNSSTRHLVECVTNLVFNCCRSFLGKYDTQEELFSTGKKLWKIGNYKGLLSLLQREAIFNVLDVKCGLLIHLLEMVNKLLNLYFISIDLFAIMTSWNFWNWTTAQHFFILLFFKVFFSK